MSAPLTVIGKYQIVDLLGQGGMGTLYLARDPSLDRLVAIKVLRLDVDADNNMRARFDREARSVSRLRHPNIVTIFEYGDHHGQPFIVMEYIAGESLDEVIRRQASLPLTRKLDLMEQLCAGMAYAHRARIIHRDLKPANLMIDDETASLRILDFGIARRVESDTSRHTGVIGTPSYMSPEQGAGRTLDHRSDIFSIGCVFYELLTYRTAFDGDTAFSVFYKVANAQPEPLETLCPGLDAAVVAIVAKLLEKKPADRYQDLDAVRGDILRARDRAAASANAGFPADTSAHTQAGPRRPGPPPPQRSTEIDRLFESAASAMQQSDFDAAMAACQQVLRLDAGNAAAVALLDRARAARDQRVVDRHVQRAREHAAAGSLTQAEQALEEALKQRGTDRAARALQRDIQQARSEQEREYHRADAAAVAIARARARLEAQAYEAAARAASEALAYAPDSADAKAILGQALEAVEQQRDAERKRRAALAETPVAPTPTERVERTRVAAAPVAAPLESPATQVDIAPVRTGGSRWIVAAATVAVVVAAGAGMLVLRKPAEPASPTTAAPPPVTTEAPTPPPPAPTVETKAPPPAISEPPAAPPAKGVTPPAPPPTVGRAVIAPERLVREARSPIDQKRYAVSVRMLEALADRFPNDPQVKTALDEAKRVDAAQLQTARDFARRGDQAMESRDYDAAIRLYQSGIDTYPEAADIVSKLTAAKAAKQILGAQPGVTRDRFEKELSEAEALVTTRLLDQAIAVYDRILAADPNNAAAKQGKARAQSLKNPKP